MSEPVYDENTPPDDVKDNVISGEEEDVEVSKNQEPVLDDEVVTDDDSE